MMILAMVNADMEGQIESKMMKSRQMEEIREARKNEAEARQEERRSKLVWMSDCLFQNLANYRDRRKRRTRSGEGGNERQETWTLQLQRTLRDHQKLSKLARSAFRLRD